MKGCLRSSFLSELMLRTWEGGGGRALREGGGQQGGNVFPGVVGTGNLRFNKVRGHLMFLIL